MIITVDTVQEGGIGCSMVTKYRKAEKANAWLLNTTGWDSASTWLRNAIR